MQFRLYLYKVSSVVITLTTAVQMMVVMKTAAGVEVATIDAWRRSDDGVGGIDAADGAASQLRRLGNR